MIAAPPFRIVLPRPPDASHASRRLLLALAVSAAMHGFLALGLAGAWKRLQVTEAPPRGDAVVLQAVLEDRATAIAPPEPTPAPPPEPPVTAPLPVAQAPAIGSHSSAGTPTGEPLVPPASAAHAPLSIDGSVAVGPVDDPRKLGDPALAPIVARYPRHIDREPRVRGTVVVPYPVDARRAHAGARVVALLELDDAGRVTHTTLLPDHPWFGPVVRGALIEARFAPAEIAAQPVGYWLALEFVFAIAPAAPEAGTPVTSIGRTDPGTVSTGGTKALSPSIGNARTGDANADSASIGNARTGNGSVTPSSTPATAVRPIELPLPPTRERGSSTEDARASTGPAESSRAAPAPAPNAR